MFAPKEHSHHDIPTRGHLHHDIPTKGHSHHGILTRRHLHHDIPTRGICIMAYPQRGICIMTSPLEDICISISVRRHLHHGLNACTGIIMNKLCIYTLAWDICIIWTFRIYILVKSICIRNEKSRLASHFVCIHRKLTSRSVVKSL